METTSFKVIFWPEEMVPPPNGRFSCETEVKAIQRVQKKMASQTNMRLCCAKEVPDSYFLIP